MSIQILYNTKTKKAISLWEYNENVAVLPEQDQAVAFVSNVNNISEISNNTNDYIVENVSGSPITCTITFSPTLPSSKEFQRVLNQIDITAENIRSKYITIGSGQSMTYIRKEDEAQRYKDAGYPPIGSPSEYPWILAEVNATGQTGEEVANEILYQRDLWLTVGTKIEEIRRSGKIAADNATSITELYQVLDDTLNQLNNLS